MDSFRSSHTIEREKEEQCGIAPMRDDMGKQDSDPEQYLPGEMPHLPGQCSAIREAVLPHIRDGANFS